ncbi:MAG: alpha/beta hydrolase [Archangium sp.]|nr:alpha/beta hydrolase [Archangium sp.]
MTLGDWEKGGSVRTLCGKRVFCREGGAADAPVLVLIHGFPTSSWDFEALWGPLTARYRVVTLDMLGFGFSEKPTSGYSIGAQADLFEARLAELGITSYHVLAHDYGDTVAQELLARKSPALKSVCFLNGGLFPETHRPLLVQKLLLSPLGAFVAQLTGPGRFDANLRRIFGPGTQPSRELLDGFWAQLTREQGLRAMSKLIHYMPERVARRERWVGALVNAAVPLKLIDGADDPVSGRHMAARYRELVPAADVTLLEGIGHYPQVEAPQAVLEAYLQFRTSRT